MEADGEFDFEFSVFDQLDNGVQIGSTVTITALNVSQGNFTALIDPGSSVFDGDSRWLEIRVRESDVGAAYTLLNPRQEFTPTPYAMNADLIDGLDSVDLVGAEGQEMRDTFSSLL